MIGSLFKPIFLFFLGGGGGIRNIKCSRQEIISLNNNLELISIFYNLKQVIERFWR